MQQKHASGMHLQSSCHSKSLSPFTPKATCSYAHCHNLVMTHAPGRAHGMDFGWSKLERDSAWLSTLLGCNRPCRRSAHWCFTQRTSPQTGPMLEKASTLSAISLLSTPKASFREPVVLASFSNRPAIQIDPICLSFQYRFPYIFPL